VGVKESMSQEIIIIPMKVPCYLLKSRNSFMLIDTGDASDREKLEIVLNQEGVTLDNLKLILLTHGDFDHGGNAAYLRNKYGVKIGLHPADWGMVEEGNQGWNRKAKSDRVTAFGKIIIFISSHFAGNFKFDRFTPDVEIEDGSDLSGYGFDAKILSLPGHSKGSIGILTADGDLFCGDLLMNMFKPELHFMIDDLADLNASLQKLKQMKIRTVYPGHGKPFAIDRFKIN
jgi:hydroxyacylglutathione hydrolase